MLIAYIIIETEPQIGQFLQAALLLPAGKRPKKAKKPDCVPIWWLVAEWPYNSQKKPDLARYQPNLVHF